MGSPFSVCCQSDAAHQPSSDILPRPRSKSSTESNKENSNSNNSNVTSKDDLNKNKDANKEYIKELIKDIPDTTFTHDLSWIHPASISSGITVPIQSCIHPAALSYKPPGATTATTTTTLTTNTSAPSLPNPALVSVVTPASAILPSTPVSSVRSSVDSPELLRVFSNSSGISRSSSAGSLGDNSKPGRPSLAGAPKRGWLPRAPTPTKPPVGNA